MKAQITQTVDPATGETVKRCAIPDEFKEAIEKVLQAHQGKLNQFMMMSQQIADLQIKWFEQRKVLNDTDQKIKERMQFSCKKLGLESQLPWTYNLADKCFELREPPDIKPMSTEDIMKYNVTPEGVASDG